MKKVLPLTLAAILLVLPFGNAYAASNENADPNSVLKEIAPGQYVAKKDGVSFEELNQALQQVQDQERTKRLKEDEKRLKDSGNDNIVVAQDGEIQGGTRWWYNQYGFNSVALTASTVWSNYPTYSSWDYATQGYTSPNFSSAMVSTTMHLYGLTTQWPPVVQSYTHQTDWVSDSYTVAISGHDWGFGIWAYAAADSYIIAAPQGTGLYHEFDY